MLTTTATSTEIAAPASENPYMDDITIEKVRDFLITESMRSTGLGPG
jgi:hypothetical protein